MKTYFLILTLLLGVHFSVSTQSLIKNGKFDQYFKTDRGLEGYHELVLKNWRQIGIGRSLKKDALVINPQAHTFVSSQDSIHEFAFIRGNVPKGIHFSTYIAQKLEQPLTKETKYLIKFDLLLGRGSGSAIRNIGACFSPKPLVYEYKEDKGERIHRARPQVMGDVIFSDTTKKMEFSGEFVARGGEQFIYIGGFGAHQYLDIKEIRPATGVFTSGSSDNLSGRPNNVIYFYAIDNVFLGVAEEENHSERLSTMQKGETLVLDDVLFDFGSSSLASSSVKTLDALVTYLKTQPSISIQISGHTDNEGEGQFNLTLSKKRAQMVGMYLIKNGIEEKRIKTTGYGETKPVAENDTMLGRQKNRRVEVEML
ncbi:MAG: OmpA family protein [Bacteroidota bacterium]